MKSLISSLTLAVGLMLVSSPVAQAVQLNFANTVGSDLRFASATDRFSFNNQGTIIPGFGRPGFQFSSGTPAPGVATTIAGLFGRITGSFQVGVITPTPPSLEVAAVTTVAPGPAQLQIWDGTTTLNADITMETVFSQGVIGGANFNGTPNILNITYSGANAALLAWIAEGAQVGTFSWQSTPTITSLISSGNYRTSYSGTLASPDPQRTPEGGSSMIILGLSLLGIAGVRWKIKSV